MSPTMPSTEWKVSVFGVFLIRIQSEWGKSTDQKNSEYTDTFHAVLTIPTHIFTVGHYLLLEIPPTSQIPQNIKKLYCCFRRRQFRNWHEGNWNTVCITLVRSHSVLDFNLSNGVRRIFCVRLENRRPIGKDTKQALSSLLWLLFVEYE